MGAPGQWYQEEATSGGFFVSCGHARGGKVSPPGCQANSLTMAKASQRRPDIVAQGR